ncbi:CES2.2 family protein [Megaselia abdita]
MKKAKIKFLCGTIAFKNPLYLTLQANSEALPNSTYLYSFDYHGEFNRFSHPSSDPLPFDQGVSLSDENLYLFPWPQKYTLRTPDDLKVAKRMVSLWTSFATTGVPQAPGMMKWHPMEHIAGPYLKIDRIVSQNENFLDEYAITVKEATLGGYSLVNDDFFSNLVEISREVDFALRKFTKQV